ncbi:hypothetical protein ACVITL_005941 [Rhizobium pisi]
MAARSKSESGCCGRPLRRVADAGGADRVGVRVSPNGETQGVRDSDPFPLFTAVLEMLPKIGIAHLALRDRRRRHLRCRRDGSFGAAIAACVQGPLILNSDFDFVRSQAALDEGVGTRSPSVVRSSPTRACRNASRKRSRPLRMIRQRGSVRASKATSTTRSPVNSPAGNHVPARVSRRRCLELISAPVYYEPCIFSYRRSCHPLRGRGASD